MANLLEDMATYLVAQGLAQGLWQDLFLDYYPGEIDNVICLSEYAGAPTQAGIDLVERRVQVLVRNQSLTQARAKAWAIFNALDKPEYRVIDLGCRLAAIQALQTPAKLRGDENGRTIFVFNLSVSTTRD